jgi:hypothetical protein
MTRGLQLHLAEKAGMARTLRNYVALRAGTLPLLRNEIVWRLLMLYGACNRAVMLTFLVHLSGTKTNPQREFKLAALGWVCFHIERVSQQNVSN